MRTWIAAGLAALLIGCGESGPSLVPISGTVTLNGAPLEGATVVFTPDASNELGQPAMDTTGPNGNFKAMTNNRSGVVPGKYRVSIVKAPAPPESTSPEFEGDPFMAQLSASGPGGATKKKKNDPASQTIEGSFDREVSAEEPILDFDVKSKSTDSAKAAQSS